MAKFQAWLANTPEGTAFKVIVGAALGAVLSWVATAQIHPLVVAIVSAITPVAINYLNGQDHRYGNGSE
jgi:hypothetical protein